MRRQTIDPTPQQAKGRPWRTTLIKAINADGSLLWPEHSSLDHYRYLWQSGSPALFSSVWMQDPSGLAGDLFDPQFFREFVYYDHHETVYTDSGRVRHLTASNLLEEGLVQAILEDPVEMIPLQAHDLAISQKEVGDYYARTNVLASRDGRLFVTDVYRARLSDLRMIADMTAVRYPRPKAIGVESVAFQEVILRQAKRAVSSLPFIPLEPGSKDKVIRARPLADHFERGQVFFLRNAPWNQMLRFELMAFPGGAYDDLVDSLAYAYDMSTRYAFGGRWGEIRKAQEDLRQAVAQTLEGAMR